MWNLDRVSPTTGANVTVKSSGTNFSGAPNDVCLTVTVNSQASDAFCLTSRTPWELVFDSGQSHTESDPTHGYLSILQYNLVDQLSTTMQSDIGWNEALGAEHADNGSNWNYGISGQGGFTNPFIDRLTGPTLLANPRPNPTPTYHNPPSGTKRYAYASQVVRVGSTTTGIGIVSQSDTLTYWVDHGTHASIQHPAKPPQ